MKVTSQMTKNKDIRPVDKNGKPHGLWEDYYDNGKVWSKCNYNHGNPHGLWEYYNSNGKVIFKQYFI